MAPFAKQPRLVLDHGFFATPARRIVVMHLENTQLSVGSGHHVFVPAATFTATPISLRADCSESGDRAVRHWVAISRFPQSVNRRSCKLRVVESNWGIAFLPGRTVKPSRIPASQAVFSIPGVTLPFGYAMTRGSRPVVSASDRCAFWICSHTSLAG